MTEKRVTKEQFDALAKKVDQGIKSGDFWLDAEDWLVILGALMLASQRAAEGEPVESTDFKRISIAERDAWLADHPEGGRYLPVGMVAGNGEFTVYNVHLPEGDHVLYIERQDANS